MAFKKLDFSKLDPNHRVQRDPYTDDDRRLFRDKTGAPRKIHRGTVVVDMDERRHPRGAFMGDVSYRARVQRDGKAQEITLTFSGERADVLREGRVEAALSPPLLEDVADFDSHIELTLEVEGAWVPRNWKDRQGKWHKAWELIVARWHYTPKGADEVLVEGRLPFAETQEEAA